ncbi:MAG: signal peptide peptidase SppA [Bacteroidales bacterium]|nr:signal peptide peptidase SppA [Bacteroidales bacterium]
MKFLRTLLGAFVGTFLALGLCLIILFGMIGSMIPSGDEAIKVEPGTILKIDLGDQIGEQTVEENFDLNSILPSFLSANSEPSTIGILRAVEAIDAAAEDPDIKFIYITNCQNSSGLSYFEEIRDALKRFRQSGKSVIAYGENFSRGGYYLASVADKIYADPFGSSNIVGMSTNIMYLKDILDIAGVEMQLIRHGKYKSAGEAYIANDISKANYEQNFAMLTSLWNTIQTDICESRGIPTEKFDALVRDLKLLSTENLKEYGLVDELATGHQMNEKLVALCGVEKEKDLKFISLGKYAKAIHKPNYKADNKIAIIYADGQINYDGDGITAEEFVPIISKIRKDDDIKAVILRVNSPGGAVQPAEQIRQELQLLREEKPLYVSYGTMAASGGYWISAQSEKIFSNKTTLTGSIGVFSLIPCAEKGFKKNLHVNPVTVKTHPHSDMGSIYRALDNTEKDAFQSQVEDIYDKFINVVSSGRGITPERVDEIAQGRVWSGAEAIEINLVNEIGGLKDVLEYAASANDLDDYRVMEYPQKKNSTEKLLSSISNSGSVLNTISDPEAMVEKFINLVKEEKGIYARIPYFYFFE